jgi:hypothetical protein
MKLRQQLALERQAALRQQLLLEQVTVTADNSDETTAGTGAAGGSVGTEDTEVGDQVTVTVDVAVPQWQLSWPPWTVAPALAPEADDDEVMPTTARTLGAAPRSPQRPLQVTTTPPQAFLLQQNRPGTSLPDGSIPTTPFARRANVGPHVISNEVAQYQSRIVPFLRNVRARIGENESGEVIQIFVAGTLDGTIAVKVMDSITMNQLAEELADLIGMSTRFFFLTVDQMFRPYFCRGLSNSLASIGVSRGSIIRIHYWASGGIMCWGGRGRGGGSYWTGY